MTITVATLEKTKRKIVNIIKIILKDTFPLGDYACTVTTPMHLQVLSLSNNITSIKQIIAMKWRISANDKLGRLYKEVAMAQF
jgi:hypothetical protein